MADGIMRWVLPRTDARVNEQRIVRTPMAPRRPARHRLREQLVGRTDDEGVERIAGTQSEQIGVSSAP